MRNFSKSRTVRMSFEVLATAMVLTGFNTYALADKKKQAKASQDTAAATANQDQQASAAQSSATPVATASTQQTATVTPVATATPAV